MRNREEKINIARFAYVLSRLKPDEEDEQANKNYKEFAKEIYNWIKVNLK